MSDLLSRLRSPYIKREWIEEAAAEIERLTAELDQTEQLAADAHRVLRATEARLSAEREARGRVLAEWSDPDQIRLHSGEMTAAEMRSVLAVVGAIRAALSRTAQPEGGDG